MGANKLLVLVTLIRVPLLPDDLETALLKFSDFRFLMS